MARKKKRIRQQEAAPLPEVRGEGKAMKHLPVVIILIAASILILMNLGNIYLWQDEAQTACIAKTILTHGVPLGYDGKNCFSQELRKEYGKNYAWRWHTWLPFYVLAGFFAAFGTSTFVCRLPFALFGIGTIILTYYFGKALWGERRAGLLAAILLILSVPFLLLARQCRYYAPMAFFSIAGLYAYTAMLDRRRGAPVIFVAASVLLFHTNYISYGALAATVIAHALIFRRDRLRPALLASAVGAILVLPWAIWLATMPYREMHAGHVFDFRTKAYLLWLCLAHTAKYIFPPAMLLLAAGVYVAARYRRVRTKPAESDTRASLALLLLFSAFTMLSISLLMPFAPFRSLAALIPVCCLIMARIVGSSLDLSPVLGLAVLFLFAQWARMPGYIYEIRHDYDGPIEGIVTYLNEHGEDRDIVAAPHEDLPIKFYTKMRVIGALTGESLSDTGKADWIIRRRFVVEGREYQVMQLLAQRMSPDDFEEITLEGYPDIMYENREDPGEHRFRTDDRVPPVVIYHRIHR